MPRYRLVLADDHPDILREISNLLEGEFDVVCTVGDGAALVEAAVSLQPDVVISDLQMPRLNGIEAGSEILRRGACDAVVVLSLYSDPQLVKRTLDAGICGYVLKLDAGEELIPAIHAGLRGECYISSGIRNGNLPR